MRKNAINWKRTWCGSICELVCPVALMMLIVAVRAILTATTSPDISMYTLQTPIYPIGKLDLPNLKYSITNDYVANLSSDLYNFMVYTNYTSGVNTKLGVYDPIKDVNSPFNFMPPHCYTPDRQFTRSPIIAVINQTNPVQKALVDQLRTLFLRQRQFADNTNFTAYPLGNFSIKVFNSSDELWDYIKDVDYGVDDSKQAVCFGFTVTTNRTAFNTTWGLEVFFNDIQPNWLIALPNQKNNATSPDKKAPDIGSYKQYSKDGYNLITNWAANAILRHTTKNADAQITTMVVPMKAPPVVTDNFTLLLQWLLPFFMMLIYIPVLYRMVYRIVFEKVTRAKESMRMMGMGEFAYWFSWYAYYTIINLVLVSLVWIVLMINAFSKTSAVGLWVFIFLYGQSLFGLVLIIQSIFQSPRAAAITTTVIYFGTAILSSVVTQENTPRSTKVAVCWLFPTVTMITGIQPLITVDGAGLGITAESWSIQFQNFSVRDSYILFIIGGVQILLLGLYLEYIMPKTYGQQRHPCFCFIDCCKPKSRKPLANSAYLYADSDDCDNESEIFETKYLNKECYEAVPREVQVKEQDNKVLKITGLKKVYENGFQAVNGVNLMMYSDQIFVLLGHNGAGKTTTISMLTGLFGASEGSAEIFGIDVFNEMSRVRQVMGVCPQHDVLFELLTVEEHLSFFYDLKGGKQQDKQTEILKLMKDVGVFDKRNALAYQLSGGNKRKLSVAIALCGGSKFVLLDEPTSGMDLSARRQLWNMLKEHKKDRIILLTTHYMDEADILGDRIGIMASGKLTALGSSIFLKSRFGVGYNLTIQKQNSEPNPNIVKYLKEHLGESVKKQSEIQQEMTIQIPIECSSRFGDFFLSFDKDLVQLQILSYGISISTLEEVFLKMGHLEDPTKPIQEEEPEEQVSSQVQIGDIELQQQQQVDQGFNMSENVKDIDESFLNNLHAVLFKRYNNYKRNRKAFLNETFIPALIMLIGVGLTRIRPKLQSEPKTIDPYLLPLPQQILVNPFAVQPNDFPLNQLYRGLPYFNDTFRLNYADWNATKNATQNITSALNFGDQVYDLGQEKSSSIPYMYGSYQFFQATRKNQQYKFLTYVNLTSQDAAGLYPVFMYDSILKAANPSTNFSFNVKLTPYPPTEYIKSRIASTSTSQILFASAISYGMIITAVVSYLVVERINGLKHLQVISGMQLKAYWIGNFIFDFCKMQVTILTTIALLFGFDLGYDNAWFLYFFLPFGVLPFTYVSSFLFTSDSAAQTFTMFGHFFIFGIGTTITYFLRLAPTLQKYGDFLNFALHIVPTYPVGAALYCETNCKTLAQARLAPTSTGRLLEEDVWARYNMTFDLVSIFLHCIFWSIQLILIEHGFYGMCVRHPSAKGLQGEQNLDDDVVNESIRVRQGKNGDIIEVKDFRKIYSINTSGCCEQKSLVAVNDLSFGLARGECFALLGVNGAGKSTTFKSLTYEVKPSKGTIMIAGLNVQDDFEKARKLIGYCPQNNLIFEDMTVEEHMVFYAQVKGIPKKLRPDLIEQAILQLGLGMHRKKPSGTLSGGNKRKLCVALAMIGNPPIIFLDEPSAGMDPESRRFMWSVVGKIAQKKTSAVVLTTHSMEEAEALSTKMGIMVKGGVFKCFGSALHIRNKFGTGYVVEIKIKTLDVEALEKFGKVYILDGELNLQKTKLCDNVQLIISQAAKGLTGNDLYRQLHSDINLYTCILELCATFQQVELIEKYGNYIRVRVSRLDKSIGFVFGLVESMKQQLDISEYSVSQTTLEQIFQSFADLTFTENVQKFEIYNKKLNLIFENKTDGQPLKIQDENQVQDTERQLIANK